MTCACRSDHTEGGLVAIKLASYFWMESEITCDHIPHARPRGRWFLAVAPHPRGEINTGHVVGYFDPITKGRGRSKGDNSPGCAKGSRHSISFHIIPSIFSQAVFLCQFSSPPFSGPRCFSALGEGTKGGGGVSLTSACQQQIPPIMSQPLVISLTTESKHLWCQDLFCAFLFFLRRRGEGTCQRHR